MRLQPIAPNTLTPEQHELFERIHKLTGGEDRGFITSRADGAMLGPYNPMLHFSQFGGAVWGVITALTQHATLPSAVRELAMLVTGAHFSARYELYAHEQSGAKAGLPPAKIASLASGTKPSDLTAEESAAFDVAKALTGGGQLPESAYQRALTTFGQQGTAEQIYLIGTYCMVSILLNGYEVPMPERDDETAAAPKERNE